MKDFFSLTRSDLAGYCRELDVAEVHIKPLLREVYKKFRETPWDEPTLPRVMQSDVAGRFTFAGPRAERASVSAYDNSVKFLVELADGARVETVLMPESRRITLCVSSQVGCAQACSFCHTGRMGLTRNLTAGEIVGQVVMANRWLRAHPDWFGRTTLAPEQTVTNIVFMGMGEPLDNTEELIRALEILTEPLGLFLGMKRISVSTAGHLDGMKRLFAAYPKASLALSLHATTQAERSRLMPINRRWPFAEVLDYLREHYRTVHDRGSLLVQYTVIAGVNDSPAHGERLLQVLEGLPAKVNLIPLNEVEPSRFGSPAPERLEALRDQLHQGGLRVMVRYSKGQDIQAACGQLVFQEAR